MEQLTSFIAPRKYTQPRFSSHSGHVLPYLYQYIYIISSVTVPCEVLDLTLHFSASASRALIPARLFFSNGTTLDDSQLCSTSQFRSTYVRHFLRSNESCFFFSSLKTTLVSPCSVFETPMYSCIICVCVCDFPVPNCCSCLLAPKAVCPRNSILPEAITDTGQKSRVPK